MAAIKKALSNRPFMGAILFVVFLYIFEELWFDFPQEKYFQIASVYFTPPHKLIAFLSGIGSMLICYFFCLDSTWKFTHFSDTVYNSFRFVIAHTIWVLESSRAFYLLSRF